MQDLRYPIGKASIPEVITEADRREFVQAIADAPAKLRAAVQGLSPEQLDTPYRPGGWTVRQVVHHYPDSHMNGYIRFRLALTEDEPTIKTYQEALWAELPEARTAPVEISLALFEALHRRWVLLLQALTAEQWTRCLVHPEMGKMPLEKYAATYAWHSRHHVAHITELRKRMGW